MINIPEETTFLPRGSPADEGLQRDPPHSHEGPTRTAHLGSTRSSRMLPVRSDNGPEFTAELIRLWLQGLQVQTLFIASGSPWENGYVESFHGKLRDELLDREIFYTLTEAKVLIERWRREYNTIRPHSALRYRRPAPEAVTRVLVGGLDMSFTLS